MELRNLTVAIATSEEARERDRLATESGIPSRVLMERAGVGAAQRIIRHFPEARAGGVEIHVGPGNNGGDGWVAASELARSGVPVRVVEASSPKTPDAINAKSCAMRESFPAIQGDAGVVVDALLGTGSTGLPRNEIAGGIRALQVALEREARVVALDVPSGMDATTGALNGSVRAELTLAFGTLKRAHLVSRDMCGIIEVLDIGLGEFGNPSPTDIALASADWVSSHIPRIPGNAHKGTRKHLAIIAGDSGMAGAAILAGRGALRSGIGILHLIVAKENRDAVHSAIPAALVSTHDELIRDPSQVLSTADAVVAGPGLSPHMAAEILKSLGDAKCPIVLDAGALMALKNPDDELRGLAGTREIVITPHPAEMAHLLELPTDEILNRRFEVGADFARRTGVTVLLKGTPTVVSHSGRGRIASATGTAALATGGSGDILSGMIGTLLAQSGDGFDSAVCAAWVHGRAAELCGNVRGVTLDDILYAMPAAWNIKSSTYNSAVLASLPSVR
ncbi:MAG: NAD(P)H-hydrate dehydratase [Gemmatimonadaceae bacterium]|nr:NAD(P)H-hydrate dehydratase [Gemmatimonadaceae bacterium]